MKQSILAISMLVLTTTTFAQKGIAVVVKTAFEKSNPKATAVKWDKEKDGTFETNCRNNSVPMSFVYNVKGELLETETEIPVSEFPTKVTDAIHKQYPTAKITGGDKIVSNKGVTKYEADLIIGKKKTEKQFDSEGNLIH